MRVGRKENMLPGSGTVGEGVGCGVGCWMKQTRKNPNQSGVSGEGRRAQELFG